MTFDAADSPVDMHRMVEIDEIRHTVNLHPGDRLSAEGTLAHQSQARVVF